MRHLRGNSKLGKPTDQRIALLRGQVTNLFLHGYLTTTLKRSRSVKSIAEKLITQGLRGTLADIREIKKTLYTKESLFNLLHKVVPVIKKDARGGYITSYKIPLRRGDGSEMVKLEIPAFGIIPKEQSSEKKEKQKKIPKK